MWKDNILEEFHQIREKHAKSLKYDLKAMFADWRKKQAASGRIIVTLPPKRRAKKTLQRAAL
ncbi:MAG: hypothetical protein WBB29_10355 [Geitlerinemataceae cyanobacterium]